MINVLLTGAGFTANFGTPLANEIYESLFNQVSICENPILKEKFLLDENLKKSNYENIYQEIMDDNSFPLELKNTFQNKLWTIFCNKVDIYCKQPNNWHNSNIYGFSVRQLVENFLFKFSNIKEKSIFFTLNQDLFIERQLNSLFFNIEQSTLSELKSKLQSLSINRESAVPFKRLGVPDNISTHQTECVDKHKIFINETHVQTAQQLFNEWNKSDSRYCFYVKLHGSQDFFYNDYPLLITGENKDTQIAAYGLIKFYNDIFKKVLTENSCRLIIIGYGFNDKHINEKINEMLEKGNCKIYVIDSVKMNKFFDNINDKKKDIRIDKFKTYLCNYLSGGLEINALQNEMLNIFLADN